MSTFKVKGYDLTRKSDNKVFTHAVVYRNISGQQNTEPAATFHVSMKLAETEAKRMAKRYWLQVQEIVEVELVA